ncbi:hypothetical protein, partial [Solemya pervernicosa gill symbiont]|uniref:hypothetical protein n=1 Tax=Solemya pervernicosa gill symbiont TaxID=642797 RepID=UPI001F3FBECB
GAVGINGRVKYLPLAWAWTPKTSFRKNSDSPMCIHFLHMTIIRHPKSSITNGAFRVYKSGLFENKGLTPENGA